MTTPGYPLRATNIETLNLPTISRVLTIPSQSARNSFLLIANKLPTPEKRGGLLSVGLAQGNVGSSAAALRFSAEGLAIAAC